MPARTGWLVGCGSADVPGEPWSAGMMGYGMRSQRTAGLHLRQRSRAFAVVDRSTGHRVVLVVADIGMLFANVREPSCSGSTVASVAWRASAAGEHRITWLDRDGGEHPSDPVVLG